jgi:hypothetical protein
MDTFISTAFRIFLISYVLIVAYNLWGWNGVGFAAALVMLINEQAHFIVEKKMRK